MCIGLIVSILRRVSLQRHPDGGHPQTDRTTISSPRQRALTNHRPKLCGVRVDRSAIVSERWEGMDVADRLHHSEGLGLILPNLHDRGKVIPSVIGH